MPANHTLCRKFSFLADLNLHHNVVLDASGSRQRRILRLYTGEKTRERNVTAKTYRGTGGRGCRWSLRVEQGRSQQEDTGDNLFHVKASILNVGPTLGIASVRRLRRSSYYPQVPPRWAKMSPLRYAGDADCMDIFSRSV